MYYQNYEDYMRSVLGYPIGAQNTYESYQYSEVPYESSQIYSSTNRYSSEVMELYPDIYKIVNPMVCKICEANTKPLTRELIDKMTDEIYLNLESQPDMNTIVNVRVEDSTPSVKPKESNRVSSSSSSTTSSHSSKIKIDNGNAESKENRESGENREDRQRRPNDNTLRDLIRILILNQLLGGNFPSRPPRPPRPRPPMRPPFPRNDEIYGEYF